MTTNNKPEYKKDMRRVRHTSRRPCYKTLWSIWRVTNIIAYRHNLWKTGIRTCSEDTARQIYDLPRVTRQARCSACGVYHPSDNGGTLYNKVIKSNPARMIRPLILTRQKLEHQFATLVYIHNNTIKIQARALTNKID